ncbi:hypothetical protein PAXRUDRAFT_778287 [Paxillus rubicundulus Ve08.2h10]|uniref:Proteophosphoglycan ppg4 n=1 Tax=Paxillus rubicundulus Ve08.2h10 TaxID=930991 RepID=A0A0D0E925_9AGAM|nr:hypothetical protein PAXRUDRAFT_778287 [Paxillus rubicundulus Ve08.2h10]
MSRLQPSTSSESPKSASAPGDSPSEQRNLSERPSSSTHPRASDGSEGYPSWLPRRPPPPDPGSTVHSSNGVHTPGLAPVEPFAIGRKATPRSVRVVSLQDATQAGRDRQATTDQIRFSNPLRPRVWSRATTAGLTPTVVSAAVTAQDRSPRPKFRSNGLHPELLRNPSTFAKLYYYLLPFITFYHIPLQTFFDFNAVFMLLQVAKFPNPTAPGVSGSGKNWALAAAAYIACWLVWTTVVFVLYELVYSFYRRWRVKRPQIIPLYLSSSGFSLTSMTSYTNFSFMQYIRFSAFFGENGSLRDGLAETCWFYSQNLPTVALLLPRAGLSLVLLLSFSSANPEYVSLVEAGFNGRDGTFFRASDGTLTDYSRGVLFANAAWTAWRTLVLFISWIGLWILSGQGCAGFCGPRYRWEEEDHEKTVSIYSDGGSDADALPWSWKACTRLRIQDAFDFCLTVKPPPRWSMGAAKKEEAGDGRDFLGVSTTPAFEVEQVLAAVGLPSVPPPARRGALSDDLFAHPGAGEVRIVPSPPTDLSGIIPKVVKRSSKDRDVAGPSAPLMKLPYPFTGYGAQVSSKDQIPFPPSPSSRKEKHRSSATSSFERRRSAEPEHMEAKDEDVEDDDDDDDDDDEEEEEEEEEIEENSEAQPRTSGSMSSLGQPITSRYPFQFRRPHNRGGSVSSGAVTQHSTPRSETSPSSNGHSRSTQSTGNRETSSESPMSHAVSSSVMSSPTSGYGNPIPMPPRHPQPGRGRARAGTVPAFPSSPSPVSFPGRIPTRVRTDSEKSDHMVSGYESFLSEEADEDEEANDVEEPQMMEQPEPEGPHEAAEGEDSVGLLGVVPRSPRSSNVSSRRRRGRRDSHSGSHSRSNSISGSGSSRSRAGSMVRSRAQSLIQSLGAASRSSLELVQSMRTRANSSMARLEEDIVYSSDSRSGSGSASPSVNENYTFGQPMRPPMRQMSSPRLRQTPSSISISAPSEATTSRLTARPETREPDNERLGIDIPPRSDDSQPDISTAAQSFITAPTTIAGTSDSSDPVPASWSETAPMVDRPHIEWRPA